MMLALGLTACHDEEQGEYSFNATMEQPTSTDSTKVFLQDERYVYWELEDKISIWGDNGEKVSGSPKQYEARLVDANNMGGETGEDFGFFNGVFITTMTWGSQYFLGMYPKSDKNKVASTTQGSSDFGNVIINIPAEQGLRTDERGDVTFNKNVFPMVAWYGGQWADSTTAYNLDFHSVASIVRVQLFNESGVDVTVDSIEFTSRNNATQLSGQFRVNNYKTEDPYVSTPSGGGVTPATARTAIANANGTSLGISMGNSTLRSFYVVLPAYKGRHETTTYELTMTVYADNNGEKKSFSRNMTVATRRNGITYMRAIALDNWASSTVSSGLVGNGTAERPFKVYTRGDLLYLRSCYNGTDRRINNQPITAQTEIRIMRSDILLRPDVWTTGINHFVGHMTYTTTGNNTQQAIVNRSSAPLFNSIDAGGVVEGITVNCDTSYNLPGQDFTPFCNTNNGTIKNCQVTSEGLQGEIIITTPGSSVQYVGGLCIINNSTGTITGSGCVAAINAERRQVGGICHTNYGTIEGCYTASTMNVSRAASVGGICYTNSNTGTVKDCYFANMITGATYDIGGIVYLNQGTVTHCYVSETSGIISSASVGGIVNTQSGYSSAKIEYCWCDGALRGNRVGLIAATLNSGSIVNSFCDNDGTVVTLQTTDNSHYGGGLVGLMSGGSLENSFAYVNKVQRINNLGVIGGLVGRVEGTSARIKNCYTYESANSGSVFYGALSGVDENVFDHCYLVNGNQSHTGITELNYTDDTERETKLATLLTSLNGYDPWGSGWITWERETNQPPRLLLYTPTK